MHAGEADDDAEILGEREPGCDVGVVVEPRADDLVAGAQRPTERPREQEVQRGHARSEGDFVRVTGEETRRRRTRPLDQLHGAHARLVRRADVRVVLAQVAGDRVDHLVRALGAARPVEERQRPVERREALADCRDVEQRRAHGSSWPLTVQR